MAVPSCTLATRLHSDLEGSYAVPLAWLTWGTTSPLSHGFEALVFVIVMPISTTHVCSGLHSPRASSTPQAAWVLVHFLQSQLLVIKDNYDSLFAKMSKIWSFLSCKKF